MDVQSVLKEKAYTEPRLLIFLNKANPSLTQGFVAAEKELLFEVSDFTVTEGIISLIATYWAYHIQSVSKTTPFPELYAVCTRSTSGKEGRNWSTKKCQVFQTFELHTVVSLFTCFR